MQEILLNVESKEMRCAHMKNGKLCDLIIERKQERQLTGNIYKGRVTNILHNIQSAFIDIKEDENGFIHISDILENTRKFEELYDMDFELGNDQKKQNPTDDGKEQEQCDIEQILKPDQYVLVQVVKEPIGTKGARLTSNISIAGRYLVLLPNSPHRGISRKIENRTVRDRLKKLVRSLDLPVNMGLICRTASAVADPDTLVEEAHELFRNWQQLMENFHKATGPTLLYSESDLIKRTLLTALDKRLDRLLVDDYATYQSCKALYETYSREHPLRIDFYRDKVPMFERFNVEREIEKTLSRKVWLTGGGYLFFDRTEAMHTIDVNSGRSSGSSSDVEESLVRINLEAAEEIARQLRLRNVGGLVICDFIDMRLRKNQKRVLERLKECMKEDSAKCTILGMSEFGLVEMTRQRHRASLMQLMCSPCPYCHGKGFIKSHESISIELERALKKLIQSQQHFALRLVVHPELYQHLGAIDKQYLKEWAEEQNAKLEFGTDDNLHINDFYFQSTINHAKLEV